MQAVFLLNPPIKNIELRKSKGSRGKQEEMKPLTAVQQVVFLYSPTRRMQVIFLYSRRSQPLTVVQQRGMKTLTDVRNRNPTPFVMKPLTVVR